MRIADLLDPANVLVDLRVATRKQLLSQLSERTAVSAGLNADLLTHEVLAREALGSTGVGSGVALPHARIEALQKPAGVFARLKRPIDFDAIDGLPVDLVLLLAIPAGDNQDGLNALATVSRALRNPDLRDALRMCANATDAYERLTG